MNFGPKGQQNATTGVSATLTMTEPFHAFQKITQIQLSFTGENAWLLFYIGIRNDIVEKDNKLRCS